MLRPLFLLILMAGTTVCFCQVDGVKNEALKPSPIFTRDTIPLSRNKYFKVDALSKIQYISDGISQDSVRMTKASRADWAEFDLAYNNFRKLFTLNPIKAEGSYIDTSSDLVELNILNPSFLYNTSKISLKQLSFNLQLLTQLLSKNIKDQKDLDLLNSVLKNTEELVNKYIATKGTVAYVLNTVLPSIKINVVDKTGAPITNAKCYFMSYRTCREIACRSCVPQLQPCDANTINTIISRADLVFDCANPVSVKVNYGRYHLFVIGDNLLRHYEELNIDERTASANEIKITALK
jgi:hypothetical protein